MKNLLILATMLLTFGFTNAQRMYDGSGRPIGKTDGSRIYDGSGRPIGKADGLRRMQIFVFFYFFM